MADRLILDTGVLIAAERSAIDLPEVIGDDDPAISAITAMELLVGVHRADPDHRDARVLHVEALLAVLPVEDYTIDVARAHALLVTHARRAGRPKGTFDLIIAATAVATGRTLITTDAAAGLDELPGLKVRTIGR